MKRISVLLSTLLWVNAAHCQQGQGSVSYPTIQKTELKTLAANLQKIQEALKVLPSDSPAYKPLFDEYMRQTSQLTALLTAGPQPAAPMSPDQPAPQPTSAPLQAKSAPTTKTISIHRSAGPSGGSTVGHEVPSPKHELLSAGGDTGAATQPSQTASDNLKNNFGFGVALGLSTNVSGPDIVTNASVDANGIVRVNTRSNTTAGFMLESHYFAFPRATQWPYCASPPLLDKRCRELLGANIYGFKQDKAGNPVTDSSGNPVSVLPSDTRGWGVGPFVAVQPGSSQIISAVGAGLMLGWRRPKGTTPSGFGLGLGYEAIPSAQVLGPEFVNGQPAPLGPNGQPLPIRYETQDKGSILAILSVSF